MEVKPLAVLCVWPVTQIFSDFKGNFNYSPITVAVEFEPELFKLKSDLARGNEFCVYWGKLFVSCNILISPNGASTLRDFFN